MDELSLKTVKPPPWGVSRQDAIPSCPIRTVRLPAVCWTYLLPSSDKVGLLKLILPLVFQKPAQSQLSP